MLVEGRLSTPATMPVFALFVCCPATFSLFWLAPVGVSTCGVTELIGPDWKRSCVGGGVKITMPLVFVFVFVFEVMLEVLLFSTVLEFELEFELEFDELFVVVVVSELLDAVVSRDRVVVVVDDLHRTVVARAVRIRRRGPRDRRGEEE